MKSNEVVRKGKSKNYTNSTNAHCTIINQTTSTYNDRATYSTIASNKHENRRQNQDSKDNNNDENNDHGRQMSQ